MPEFTSALNEKNMCSNIFLFMILPKSRNTFRLGETLETNLRFLQPHPFMQETATNLIEVSV